MLWGEEERRGEREVGVGCGVVLFGDFTFVQTKKIASWWGLLSIGCKGLELSISHWLLPNITATAQRMVQDYI